MWQVWSGVSSTARPHRPGRRDPCSRYGSGDRSKLQRLPPGGPAWTSLHGQKPVLGRKRDDLQVLEANLLRNLVAVELQADRRLLDSIGLGVAPVDHGRAVDRDAHTIALCQDLEV